MRKGRKIVFVLGLVGRVSVCSHYCSEIQDFPHADNGRSRYTVNFRELN